MYRATNDHFVVWFKNKHNSEKLIMLELANNILPKQA